MSLLRAVYAQRSRYVGVGVTITVGARWRRRRRDNEARACANVVDRAGGPVWQVASNIWVVWVADRQRGRCDHQMLLHHQHTCAVSRSNHAQHLNARRTASKTTKKPTKTQQFGRPVMNEHIAVYSPYGISAANVSTDSVKCRVVFVSK